MPLPTVSNDTTFSNNESDILRCNKRLLLNAASTSQLDNAKVEEVRKTIEIGCLIGFNMIGKEHDVSAIIGENVMGQ
ncbi:hypothetical protein Tco_0557415 [Tanacetum coccineum]